MTKLKFSKWYLLMPIVLIVFFLSIYFIYEDIKKRTILEFNKEQLILAKTASQGITSFFDDNQSNLTFLTQLIDIKDFTKTGEELLIKFYKNNKNVLNAITRMDSNGKILFTYPYNESVIGSDISSQKHVQQIINTHKPVISDVFMAVQNYLAIAIAVPIFKEKEFVGSITILIPIDILGEYYLGNIETRGTGNIWLLSENNVEIYCPIKGHTGKSFLTNTNNDATTFQLIDKIIDNKSGTVKGVHEETIQNGTIKHHKTHITFYKTDLGNTFWTILISYNEKDVYDSLTKLRNRLILVTCLLLIIMAYFAYTLVRVRNIIKEETKRKKAEKTLQESEKRFKDIVFSIGDWVWEVDEKGFYTYSSEKGSELFDIPQKDIIGKSPSDFMPPDEAKRVRKFLNEISSKKLPIKDFENWHINSKGESFCMLTNGLPIIDKNGNLKGYRGVDKDITRQKRNEELINAARKKAEESDQLKTAFLQNMSHEIRTPMNAIMGFSSLLVKNFNNKPKLKHFSEIINLRSKDLLEIINDILDVSKIESGQLELNIEKYNVNDLFTELSTFFKEYQKKIGKEQILLKTKTINNPANIIIQTDKIKLRQIFINLIGNALKFTSIGHIEIGYELDSDQNIVFFVSDTGIGIPNDKQNHIFDRFAQLNLGSDKINSGTGLGLSIVKGLVELLNGKIWIESEIEKGTCFYFSLPLN